MLKTYSIIYCNIFIHICIYSILFVMPSLFDKEPFWWTVTSWPKYHLSQTHNVISNPPPPLLVGVGAEEMTARRLYISWPGHQSNYSTANLYTGRVNRLWGEGAQDEGAPRRGGGGNVIVYKCSLRYLEGNLFLLRPYQYLEGNLFLLRPYQ